MKLWHFCMMNNSIYLITSIATGSALAAGCAFLWGLCAALAILAKEF
jgi:hypothetical protein